MTLPTPKGGGCCFNPQCWLSPALRAVHKALSLSGCPSARILQPLGSYIFGCVPISNVRGSTGGTSPLAVGKRKLVVLVWHAEQSFVEGKSLPTPASAENRAQGCATIVSTIENLRRRQAQLRLAPSTSLRTGYGGCPMSLESNQRKKTCAESSTWIVDFLRAPVRTLYATSR